MKVFIPGGAGFIGSHLVAQFLSMGHEVVAFDNLILGRRELLEPFKADKNFRFVEADLNDLARVKKEMHGSELVVHMAANSDISQGAARTDVDMTNGTLATYNVLEAMRTEGVKKLLFASTSAIYGEAEQKPTTEAYGPLMPISFYGASKLACEAMVSAFSHNCQIQAWVYRFANIVGSHATHGAVFDFVGRLLKSPTELHVLGNGTQRKSYLHVSDCVAGMLYGYTHATDLYQVFNLASRGVTSVRVIAEEVVKQMAPHCPGSKTPKLVFGEGDRGWVGDVPYTYLDGTKFEKLGWKALLESDAAVVMAVGEIVSERVAFKRRAGAHA